ncbi:hypothetical protein BDF14DRAFT_1787055 [Spinellus fusiger]|nr:hypothetical protein BDF14DRAFT_1787055 [Spinellus fusiger]
MSYSIKNIDYESHTATGIYATNLPSYHSPKGGVPFSKSSSEDTDTSEAETALDTPTGLTDDNVFLLRSSSTFSTYLQHNQQKQPPHKPQPPLKSGRNLQERAFEKTKKSPTTVTPHSNTTSLSSRTSNLPPLYTHKNPECTSYQRFFSENEDSSDDEQDMAHLSSDQVHLLERQLSQLEKSMALHVKHETDLRRQLKHARGNLTASHSEQPSFSNHKVPFIHQSKHPLSEKSSQERRSSFWDTMENIWSESGADLYQLFSLSQKRSNKQMSGRVPYSAISITAASTFKVVESGDRFRQLKDRIGHFRDTLLSAGTNEPVQASSLIPHGSNSNSSNTVRGINSTKILPSKSSEEEWYYEYHRSFCTDIIKCLDLWIESDTTSDPIKTDTMLKEDDRGVLDTTDKESSLEITSLRNQNTSLVHALQKLQVHCESVSTRLENATLENSQWQQSQLKKQHLAQETSGFSEQDESGLKTAAEYLEEKKEIEQILEVIHVEMKTVIEELDETKQECLRWKEQAQRVRTELDQLLHVEGEKNPEAVIAVIQKELKTELSVMEQEMKCQAVTIQNLRNELRTNETLCRELKQMKSSHEKELARLFTFREKAAKLEIQRHALNDKLVDAEKAVAECDMKIEAAKTLSDKQLQASLVKISDLEEKLSKSQLSLKRFKHRSNMHEEISIEIALQRVVAERDGEISKMKRKIDDLTRKITHRDAAYNSRHEQDKEAWKEHIVDETKLQYQRDLDIFKVQNTREIREMASQIAELEHEIEEMMCSRSNESERITNTEKKVVAIEQETQVQKLEWEKEEKELKTVLHRLEQKIVGLEGETVRLYEKNLDLAHRLGHMVP